MGSVVAGDPAFFEILMRRHNQRIYRAGVTLASIFTFGNARCDRVVASVMARVS